MPNVSFVLDDTGKRLTMTLEGKGLLFSQVNTELVNQLLDENYPQWCQFSDAIAALVTQFDNDYRTAKEPDEVCLSEVVAECKDATFVAEVSDDDMTAIVQLKTAQGGKPVSVKDIALGLQEVGVKKGIHKEKLLKLIANQDRVPPGSDLKVEVASGRPPIDGKDAKFEALIDGRNRMLKPQELASGKVDMRNLGAIVSVKPGDGLMRRHPATQGKQGYTISGDILEPRAGEDSDFVVGEGTKIDGKDQNLLVADKTGLPRPTARGMEVDEILEVPGVDVKSGHIEFEGAVIVAGDVGEGMKVKAKGDVTVAGFVESATIEAGGDISIAQGVVGRKIDGEELSSQSELTCHLTAGGNIHVRYAQYVEFNTHARVMVDTQLMHSRLNVGSVWVGSDEDRPDGKVIGGMLSLEDGLQCGELGAPAATPTLIDFSAVEVQFETRLAELTHPMDELESQLQEVRTAIEHLKKVPASEQQKALLSKAMHTFTYRMESFKKLNNKKEILLEERDKHLAKLNILATQKLYPGVQVHVRTDTLKTGREYGPSKISLNQRVIEVTPYNV